MLKRFLTTACLLWAASLAVDADDRRESEYVEMTVEGRVLGMPEIMTRKAIKADLPILSDDGGRLFFLDPAMRDRPARLKLRTSPDLPFAQVIHVEIEHEGRWRIPQYYCDVCTIAVRYPQICLCCQGPMEFRFKPER